MGYLMRYIITDEREITLSSIETALQQVDPTYAITNVEVNDLGDLMFDGERLAIIEINRPGDDMFEDDLAELADVVGKDVAPAESKVHETLSSAKTLVVLEVFWLGEDAEPVLSKIDPLWDWLFANYAGIAQADSEGFYDASGMILERNFTL
jgi:hypothetical protein